MSLTDLGVPADEYEKIKLKFEDDLGGPKSWQHQVEKFRTYWAKVVGKRPDNPPGALYSWMRREVENAGQRGPRRQEGRADPTLEGRFNRLWDRVTAALTSEILTQAGDRPEPVPVPAWHEAAHDEARAWALQQIADAEVDAARDERARASSLMRSFQANLSRKRDDFARDFGVPPPACTRFDRDPNLGRESGQGTPSATEEIDW